MKVAAVAGVNVALGSALAGAFQRDARIVALGRAKRCAHFVLDLAHPSIDPDQEAC